MRQSGWTKCISVFVFTLILCIGAMALIGCVDDDDDYYPKAYVRIYNGVLCYGGTPATVKLTIDDTEIWAESGKWSGCAEFTPGSHTGTVYMAADCGIRIDENISFNLPENCTYEFLLVISDGQPVLKEQQNCPGACPNP